MRPEDLGPWIPGVTPLANWPPRIRVDPVGGLRLLLMAVRDGKITVDQALECFTNDASAEATESK